MNVATANSRLPRQAKSCIFPSSFTAVCVCVWLCEHARISSHATCMPMSCSIFFFFHNVLTCPTSHFPCHRCGSGHVCCVTAAGTHRSLALWVLDQQLAGGHPSPLKAAQGSKVALIKSPTGCLSHTVLPKVSSHARPGLLWKVSGWKQCHHEEFSCVETVTGISSDLMVLLVWSLL